MTKGEAVNWLINIMADIGKIEHQELWHYEQALAEIRDMLEEMSSVDCISRQAAIDEIKVLYEWHEIVTEDRAIDHFKRLPSAEPERKRGWWIETDDGWDGVYCECSCCKEAFTLMDGTPTDNLYNYCPSCGADMRGGESDG